MEIKATLQKPYTFEQKRDFIIVQNRQNGYEIRETEDSLQAWGYTEEEIEEQQKETKRQEIIQELNILDLKSIRAIRANDTEYIEKYEAEAQELREQLRELD